MRNALVVTPVNPSYGRRLGPYNIRRTFECRAFSKKRDVFLLDLYSVRPPSLASSIEASF